MKRVLLLVVIIFEFLATSAQWSVVPSVGALSAMQGDKDLGAIGVEISHPVSDLFSFGLLAEYLRTMNTDPDHYSNIVFEIKTDLSSMIQRDRLWDIFLDTGIGWGHHITKNMVDHNFHTYRIGADIRLYRHQRTVAGVMKIGSVYRSRNEHMIDGSSGKLYFLIGVCLVL